MRVSTQIRQLSRFTVSPKNKVALSSVPIFRTQRTANFVTTSGRTISPNPFPGFPQHSKKSARAITSIYRNMDSMWTATCKNIGLAEEDREEIWKILCTRYNEPQRYYHTLDHIQALLNLADKYDTAISDKITVYLAIYFHDIVYDPKSKTNEEDSAELFAKHFRSVLDEATCQKVYQYIIETKKHDVEACEDKDLKLFIDFDMSILGQDVETYAEYARNVRKEYEFVPEEDYCKGRATVLTSFLQAGLDEIPNSNAGGKKFIFASQLFRDLYEDQARRNLAWECEILQSGKLV